MARAVLIISFEAETKQEAQDTATALAAGAPEGSVQYLEVLEESTPTSIEVGGHYWGMALRRLIFPR